MNDLSTTADPQEEIEALKMALEEKSEEIKRLRAENADLNVDLKGYRNFAIAVIIVSVLYSIVQCLFIKPPY